MNLDQFIACSTREIHDIVQARDPMTVVFTLNGTRRWFLLEHQLQSNLEQTDYFDIVTQRLIELCRMFFDHGLKTLVLPIISPYLLRKRGPEYTQMVIQSLGKLTYGDAYRTFYDEADVRVRFYGDFQTFGDPMVNSRLAEQFAAVARETAHHQTNRLFWGVCAHDATEQVTEQAIAFYQEHGRKPTKQELIELYYGETVEPVDLYISASKPRAFDMPLISSGRESLYFTVAPSPYMTQTGFRKILYDHLFNRQATHIHYQDPQSEQEDWEKLKEFYRLHQDQTLGVGESSWGVWRPTPQLMLPTTIS